MSADASTKSTKPRRFDNANAMIEAHVDELEAFNNSDTDQMVGDAMMTAAFILYVQHEGDVEDAIQSMYRATRRAIEAMENPRFRQPH